MEAGKMSKGKGLDNNLLELIAADPAFNLTLEELNRAMEPSDTPDAQRAGGRIP